MLLLAMSSPPELTWIWVKEPWALPGLMKLVPLAFRTPLTTICVVAVVGCRRSERHGVAGVEGHRPVVGDRLAPADLDADVGRDRQRRPDWTVKPLGKT